MTNVIEPFSEDAQIETGFTFWCDGCKMRHMVYVRSDNQRPNWSWNGSRDKPTFSPSILVHYDYFSKNGPELKPGQHYNMQRVCHSFVTDGKIQYLTDSNHSLAGQTVDLQPVNDKGYFSDEDK